MSEASMDSVSMSECILDDNDETRQSPDADFRLSLAGFPPCNPLNEVVDDLTSAYPGRNNTLESLRRSTTSLIQDSEDIVSRSIINALSEDNENRSFLEPALTNSWESSSTSIGSNVQIPTLIEANVLSEAFEWSNLNVNCAPRIDIEEQKRLFLQKQMDAIFVHAHQERLSEEVASRIVLDIATLLDIPINPYIQRERDTLIIRDLKKEIDLDTLTATLMVFDELREVGVASNRSFAFCRFASERGPLRAFSAADQGTLIINGKPPQLSVIQKPLTSGKPGLLVRRAMSSTDFRSDRLMPKPIFGRQRSHQRNTISIDTLIVESPPFRRLINDAVKVAPLDIASFQKKDYFGKMSSMHTSESVPSLSNSTRIYGTTSSC